MVKLDVNVFINNLQNKIIYSMYDTTALFHEPNYKPFEKCEPILLPVLYQRSSNSIYDDLIYDTRFINTILVTKTIIT